MSRRAFHDRAAVAEIQADLLRAVVAAREAQRQVDRDIAEARQRGLSWAEIAEPLGVTKQSAQAKYGSTRVSLTDEPMM